MRIQAFLWTYLPILGEEYFFHSGLLSHFLAITQCHTDLDNHKSTRCYEKCARLVCTRLHPCVRLCHEPCGNCEFPISNVTLPCGHVEKEVPWYVWKPCSFNDINMNSRRFQPQTRGPAVRQVQEKGLKEASVL